MEKVVKVFANHAEQEQADLAYYRSLTGEQRIQIMLELIAREHGTSGRFERVCRIIKPPQR